MWGEVTQPSTVSSREGRRQGAFARRCWRGRPGPGVELGHPGLRSAPRRRHRGGCGPGSAVWRPRRGLRGCWSARGRRPGRGGRPGVSSARQSVGQGFDLPGPGRRDSGAGPCDRRPFRRLAGRPELAGGHVPWRPAVCDWAAGGFHTLQTSRGYSKEQIHSTALFHVRFGQVARLVHIGALGDGGVIGQKLRGDRVEDRGEGGSTSGRVSVFQAPCARLGHPLASEISRTLPWRAMTSCMFDTVLSNSASAGPGRSPERRRRSARWGRASVRLTHNLRRGCS